MELVNLLDKLKMDHLEAQLDAVCEQAAQKQLDYKTFLNQALSTEWQGRYQRGIEARLRQARFPWMKQWRSRPTLPARVGDLFEREERCIDISGGYEAIADYVSAHAVPRDDG